MPKKFLRQESHRHSKIGKGRRKLQKWRASRGRHSKMRRKRFGYPASPTIGYGTPRVNEHKVKGLYPVLVHNLKELSALDKTNIAILARVGAKKKLELMKKAEEMKIPISNAGGKK